MEKKPTDDYMLPWGLLFKGKALLMIVVGVILLPLAYWFDDSYKHGRFWFAYMMVFMFWASISLGSLALVIIHYLVRAHWSVVVRRIAENLTLNFTVCLLLAVPFFIKMPLLQERGMDQLYNHWIHNSHIVHSTEEAFDKVLAEDPVMKTDGKIKTAILKAKESYVERRKKDDALNFLIDAKNLGWKPTKVKVHNPDYDPYYAKKAKETSHAEETPHSGGGHHAAFDKSQKEISAYVVTLVDYTDSILLKKVAYLNEPFFIIRAFIYLIVWMAIAGFYSYHSSKQDSDAELVHTRLMNRFAPPAAFLAMLTLSFAGFDWIMSIESHWFSTMFGVYYFAGSMLCMFAFIYVVVYLLRMIGALKNTITTEHDHDLGKYMLGFTIFWTYISYSQFMLIAYGNIPEETFWFEQRWTGTWKLVSLALIFLKFAFPFIALISKHVKRNSKALFLLALWIIVMHVVDIYWMIMPGYLKGDNLVASPQLIHGVDILLLIGFSSIFLGYFIYNMTRRAIVPVNDPWLEESINFENH